MSRMPGKNSQLSLTYGYTDSTEPALLKPSPNSSNEPWSDYQKAIYEFGEECLSNLLIQAVAGSGKSTTLFELATRLKGGVLFLAFNKIIAKHASTKLGSHKNIECRTFHSFGMQLVQMATGFYAKIDTNRLAMYFNSLEEFHPRFFPSPMFYPKPICRKIVRHIRQLGMMSYKVEDVEQFIRETPKVLSIDPRKRSAEEGWVYRHLEQFPKWLKDLDTLPERPSMRAQVPPAKPILTYKNVIDFDDMVRMPCVHNLALRFLYGRDTALIDEAQDMNPYQIHLVAQMYKLGLRLFCCGDKLQSIYSFRGSYMDSMDRMKKVTEADELPLSVTYRSRQAIVDFVNGTIPESAIIAHKPGGSVEVTAKEHLVQTVVTNDVRMIIGAKNKNLLECWITLAKNRISSSLKGSKIVTEIRDIIDDIQPATLEELCQVLREVVNDATLTDEDGVVTYKISALQVELITAIPELIEACEVDSLQGLENILKEMERDAPRELHTVHSAKGLEAPVVMVLCDWFNSEQLINMKYVAFTRAEDTLILIEDWERGQERNCGEGKEVSAL